MELKFIQSHIQLLTEELSEMDVTGENRNAESQGNRYNPHRDVMKNCLGLLTNQSKVSLGPYLLAVLFLEFSVRTGIF